jgi:hypothetical protein
MNLPFINNSNKLTWKCKFFGCRDEFLPLVLYKQGEQHGITSGFSCATAVTTSTGVTYKGCYWCKNYQEIMDEPTLNFPAWLCDCNICVSANHHRKWLYEKD